MTNIFNSIEFYWILFNNFAYITIVIAYIIIVLAVIIILTHIVPNVAVIVVAMVEIIIIITVKLLFCYSIDILRAKSKLEFIYLIVCLKKMCQALSIYVLIHIKWYFSALIFNRLDKNFRIRPYFMYKALTNIETYSCSLKIYFCILFW